MEEIFDNILFLVPVAFIIAARIFNARQKQAHKQGEKEPAPPPPAAQKPKAPEEARPHWEVPDWPDIKKNTAPAKPVKPKKPAKTPQPKQVHFPEAEPPASGGKPHPAAGPQSVVLPEQETTSGPFAADLTPLQTAMVWSEILGPPRSDTL